MAEIKLACNCNDQYDATIELPESKAVSNFQPKVINLNFGKVRVCKEKTLKVPIKNDAQRRNDYVVHRNTSTVPIYDYFRISQPNMFSLGPGESTIIKIYYKPLIRNMISNDFYTIADSGGNVTRIIVTATSIGPMVQLSTDLMRFNTWPAYKTCTKAFEITNLSDFPLQFTFDIDDTPKPIFEVVPSAGIIDGQKHLVVNITFCANQFGEYSKRFFCMIHTHRPLILDCFGVYWRSKEDSLGKHYVKYPETIENNFVLYMRDVQVTLKAKPTFSFNDAYLNFGTVDIERGIESTLVTSLTNHRDEAVIIKWFPDDYFKMTPAKIEVPANESILFECTFRPLIADNIFSRNLLMNVYSTQSVPERGPTMPMPAVLRVLGHSFGENKLWIPQFEINPGLVVLPPVLPGETCFTTIELKSAGYLATSFTFVSPTSSCFLVKPMMGTVRGTTIVVVQLVSDRALKAKLYVEQWFVLLNNDRNHKIPVCLKGYAELPSIAVGEHNTITLKGVQIGCTETVAVPLRNTCQHLVYYEFLDYELTDGVSISKPKGSLPPNATVMVEASFQSSSRICKQLQTTCLVYATYDIHEVYGSPVDIPVTIYIQSDHSKLCSIPAQHDFGTIECNSTHTTEFRMFNYGTTTIHFQLSLRDKHSELRFEGASIEPTIGSLAPQAHMDCLIRLIPTERETIDVDVYYALRTGPNGLETLPNTSALIFRFGAIVIYPYFQVIEIADHNFGPLFSKRTVWDFLNINWLNYALAEVEADSNETAIDMNLPDAELNGNEFYVTLMVKNVTQFPVHVSLKRRKLCDCELQEVEQFVSIRKKMYQCPHRQMFKLSIVEETILPQDTQTMTLEIRYTHPGATKLSYFVTLGGNRQIVMDFNIRVIGLDEAWLSKYNATFTYTIRPVCFAEKQPNIHALWLYNNTQVPMTYHLVEDPFAIINAKYAFDIFNCLNPKGIIDAFSAKPLLLGFHPLDKTNHHLHLPLLIGDNARATILQLRASGKTNLVPHKQRKQMLPNAINPSVPIHLSLDRLIFPPFPVWSTATRMLFITNMSDDIMGYNWLPTHVAGICEVEILEPNRVLRPKQTDTVICQVKALGRACLTRVHVPCKLINHSKYLQHQKSMIDYERRQRDIRDEFIITERGMSFPANDIEILPEPDYFYVTLALELDITSRVDRDIHHSPDGQFKHSPSNILTCSVDQRQPSDVSMLSRPIHPIQQPRASTNDDDLFVEDSGIVKLDPNVDDVAFYQHVIEALLADTMFSNFFHKILDMQKKTSPKYYTQIRPPRDADPVPIREELENVYKEPQMPFVKDIIHDLLLKSMDDIFQLRTEAEEVEIDYDREVDLPNVCNCINKKTSEDLLDTENVLLNDIRISNTSIDG